VDSYIPAEAKPFALPTALGMFCYFCRFLISIVQQGFTWGRLIIGIAGLGVAGCVGIFAGYLLTGLKVDPWVSFCLIGVLATMGDEGFKFLVEVLKRSKGG